MRIETLCVVGDYGTLTVRTDESKTEIKLSKEDCQQAMYLAERIYEQHQQRIAKEFSQPLPAIADFTEVVE